MRLRAWAGSEASITGGLQEASCLDGTRGFDYRRITSGLVLGWDLRLRLQEDYRRLRAWTGSEASGFISFPGNQKTRLENPFVLASWLPRNHGDASICFLTCHDNQNPDEKTRLWWRHGCYETMVMSHRGL